MNEAQKLKEILLSGDATAVLAIADDLADRDDPRSRELADLAVEIVSTEDWAVAEMATALFLALLETEP